MKHMYAAVYIMVLCAVTVADAAPSKGGSRFDTPISEDVAEDDDSVPVDYGWGPRPPSSSLAANPLLTIQATDEGFRELDATAMTVATDAHLKGQFSDPFSWPVIPIHVTLLPNGNVHSFGTDTEGQQGAALWHSVWDPELGTDAWAHTVLSNTVNTDIFCAGQSLLPHSGKLLITGGDMIINGDRNWSNADTNIFDPETNELVPEQPMQYKRWYPTLVALPNGEMVVLGGRAEKSTESAPAVIASTPELYTPGTGWRTLFDATSDRAYGSYNTEWYYPRAFPAPNGLVWVLTKHGRMYYLDPTGNGSIIQTGNQAPGSDGTLPTLNIEPGKFLSVRKKDDRVILFDLNVDPPTFTDTGKISGLRVWSSGMVLPDGRVLVSGGSTIKDDLATARYEVEIWDPATGTWSLGAAAQKPRFYHSVAMLLPDASVLTAGGGAPGPVKNLNAELYYPNYLFETDGSGQWAERPSIESAPENVSLGGTFDITVADGNTIDRVTFLRLGTSTHSYDSSARFMELSFIQNGAQLTITAPTDMNLATPGFWMLFVLDDSVPSVAKIVHLTQNGPGSSDTTAPSIPTGLNATAVSSSEIELSWDASSDEVGVAGYEVYRDGAQIATVTGTSYQDTGLSASTTYSYTVAAYDAAGNKSAQSDADSATTPGSGGTDLPVDLQGSPPEEKTITFTVAKPIGATEATVVLTAYDADQSSEGKLYVNGNGPIALFGSAGVSANDTKTADITVTTPANWWTNGDNALRFMHVRTGGYRIDAINVSFP